MKKILTLLLLFLSSLAVAQTQKGSFMIGGSGTMSFNKNDWDGSGNSKNTTLNLSPDVGYFLTKNLAVGLWLPLGYHGRKRKSRRFPRNTMETAILLA
jgi:outer membrane protein